MEVRMGVRQLDRFRRWRLPSSQHWQRRSNSILDGLAHERVQCTEGWWQISSNIKMLCYPAASMKYRTGSILIHKPSTAIEWAPPSDRALLPGVRRMNVNEPSW